MLVAAFSRSSADAGKHTLIGRHVERPTINRCNIFVHEFLSSAHIHIDLDLDTFFNRAKQYRRLILKAASCLQRLNDIYLDLPLDLDLRSSFSG